MISKAKSIIKKKLDDYDKLTKLCDKHVGYIGQLTHYLFNECVGVNELSKLLDDLIYLRSKHKQIDITKLTYEQSVDLIEQTKIDINVSTLINEFPSHQKKLALDNINRYKNLFNKISKKDFSPFISKISRYKTWDDLHNAMVLFGKDVNNTKEFIIDTINNKTQSTILFENDDILIIDVDNISDLIELASDTSWCILRDHNWKSYTNGRKQFILYDWREDEFSVNRKIGFTLNLSGSIHAAHNIVDGYWISEIREIFNKYDINTQDLFFIKTIDHDVSKIPSNISNSKLSKIITEISQEKLLELFKRIYKIYKVDSVSHLTPGKRDNVISCLNRLLKDYKYFTKEMLIDIDQSVYETITDFGFFRDMYVRDCISGNYNQIAMDKAIDYVTDKQLCNLSDMVRIFTTPYYNKTYLPNDIKLKYNKETLIKLAKRLNSLYNNHEKIDEYELLLCNLLVGTNDMYNYDELVCKYRNTINDDYTGLLGYFDLPDEAYQLVVI